jgi:hypothetical protein
MADALEQHVCERFLGMLDSFELVGTTAEGLDELAAAVERAETELAVFRDDLPVREALGTDPGWRASTPAPARSRTRRRGCTVPSPPRAGSICQRSARAGTSSRSASGGSYLPPGSTSS